MKTDSATPPLIHVGFPKAMSSWLQKYLFTEDNGYRTILDPLACQLQLIKPAPFHFRPEGIGNILASPHMAATGTNLVPVVTSEALVGNFYAGGYDAKEIADRLFAIAPHGKLLLITREQKSLIRSLYKTWMAWGLPYAIDEILNPLTPDLSPRFNWEFLEYDARVLYYQTLFGKENVLVIPYEFLKSEPEKYVRAISGFAGASTHHDSGLSRLPFTKKINRGQSLAWLYYLRLQNRYWYKTPFNHAGFVTLTNDRLMARIRKAKKNPLPDFTNDWFEQDFQRTVAETVGDRYARSNRNLEAILGISLKVAGYMT